MNYVYPKLSGKDFLLFRVGGAGLGNILFAYARAIVFANKNNCKVIWPTWFSFKIGPILRNETDKRLYNDLFDNNSGYISGLKKAILLATKKHIKEENVIKAGILPDDKIIEFEGFDNLFLPIYEDSQIIKKDLIRNLKKKNKTALDFDSKKAICMHVRLGDFYRVSWEEVLQGKHDSSIPIQWYVKITKEIRKITGQETKVYVFSDGTDEELKPLLDLPNVERKTYGSAIADIMALSNSRIFVASGSSFSMWVRYLGRMTTIMFPNQIKQKILLDREETKEIIALTEIDEQYHTLIRTTLSNN